MKRFMLFCGIVCSLASVTLAQKSLDLGTISRLGAARTVPVEWEVPSENLRPLIDRAFGMNGGLLRVSGDRAAVLITIRQVEARRVELLLMGTKPRRVIYRETFEDGRAAFLALRAADRAVEKILGLPGFYTGKLAFVSDRTGKTEVYVGDLFFQSVRQITSDKALVVAPRLAPNGQSLTYTSFYRAGYPDVFRIDLQSGRRTPIASFRGLNSGGSWSPTGDALALILSSSGNPEVYLADPAGRRFKRLTRTQSVEASPSFAPDGARVIFASDLMGRPQLYITDVAGGPMRRVQTNISNYCAEPVWNPRDPNLIAFTAGMGRGFQVAVYDFVTRKSKVVTRESGDAIEPTWMADGRHLIYTARSGTSRRLTMLDTETGKTTPLHSTAWGKSWQASFSK